MKYGYGSTCIKFIKFIFRISFTGLDFLEVFTQELKAMFVVKKNVSQVFSLR